MTGRPALVTKEIFINALLEHKDEIILRSGRIAAASQPVWGKVNEILGNKYRNHSIRALVFKNIHKVRDILTNQESLNSPERSFEDINNLQDDRANISLNSTIEEDVVPFDIMIPMEEWLPMLEKKDYKRNVGGRSGKRTWTILKPGLWQRFLSEKVWNVIRSRCSFNAKCHRLTLDGLSGRITTYCTCGTELIIHVDSWNKKTMVLHCVVKWGTQVNCRKNYLRQPIRAQTVEAVNGTSVKGYLTEECDKFMNFGDPEPPFIPKPSVLYTAKNEAKSSQFLDPDPVKAILMMKKIYPNMIHKVCYDPFYIHYWSNHQEHMFRTYSSEPDAVISCDATGSIVASFTKPSGEKTSPIFFYEVVIRCSAGQFSVTQMISEIHTALEIANWLREWRVSVGITARGMVVDRGLALQNGIIQAFTTWTNLSEYSDAWWDGIPSFILRNDVAHFLKNYAEVLRNAPRHLKTMLMAGMGRLLQIENMDEMRQLLKVLLTIAMSPTSGNLISTGELTECQKAKQTLKALITVPIDDIVSAENEKEDDGFMASNQTSKDPSPPNRWSELACEVKAEVEKEAVWQEGDEDNVTNDAFVDKLVTDMTSIPVWGNVCISTVDPTHRTASSASSESNFNILKNCVFKGCRASSLRVDEALDKHCSFLRGTMKRVKAVGDEASKNQEIQQDVPEHLSNEPDDGGRTSSSKDTSSPHGSEEEKENFSRLNRVHSNAILCMACDNGDYATGAHKCRECGKNVHIFLACSVPAPGSKEGYGQERICIECNAKLVTPDVDVASNKVYENWGNKVFLDQKKKEARKKKALYLGENSQKVKDRLDWTKHPSLPILKNGTDCKLKASRINGESWSFANTCAFDSIYQVILAGAVDDETFRELISSRVDEENIYFIVLDTIDKTQRTHTYTLRGKILLNLNFPRDQGLVKCETDIITMARKLFADHPSCRQYFKCYNIDCGYRWQDVKHVLAIDYLNINTSTFTNILRDNYCEELPKDCERCHEAMFLEKQEFGEIIIFDVYSSNGQATNMILDEIPKYIFNPLVAPQKKLSLIGIVRYQGNPIRFDEDDRRIGHYTGVVPRYPEWIEMCGLQLKRNDRKDKLMKVNVALLMYGLKKDYE